MKAAVYYENGGPEAHDAHAYVEGRSAFGRVVMLPR